MKNKLFLTATAATLSLGLLTGCGTATNDFNDTNFDTNPVRYNPAGKDNLMNQRLNEFDPVRNNERGTNRTDYIDINNTDPMFNNNDRNYNRNRYKNQRINNRDNNVNTGGTLHNGTFR